ncbi:hypothetical protein ES754_09345 [Psychrobacter frigidicola]|uniref:CHAP domain-containing protein n=2 Tax=Psychrobacter frigidicola TaxID=45611 RepID=A0A5C7A4C0_9GAMM|nr:hypothetical protein ES754_09345 [Psychrobacter frigidicola]
MPALLFLLMAVSGSQVHADSMSDLIAQKYTQPELAVPAARISTRSSIQRTQSSYQAPTVNYSTTATNYPTTRSLTKNTPTVRYPNNNTRYTISEPVANNEYNYNSQPTRTAMQPTINTNYRYPTVQRKMPSVLPAFLSNSYDNVDSKYLPLLSNAEAYSSPAAREVMSTARAMSLNERTIIQGGCWDYLNAVFNRAGVTKNTVHNGVYEQGPYASSNEIEVGDWLYYINHGYNDIEHSGLFVGWVDESAKQALILSYAGESRQEPARYRVYDLSHVYQIMRPTA